MKKILLVLLLISCATPSWAQQAKRPKTIIEWGVLGGVNIPNFSTSDTHAQIKNKLGWHAGIVTAVNLGPFAIEPQILYMRQGMKIQQSGKPEVDIKSSSIDIPVLFSLRILRPLRLHAGPVFTVMNDCKQKSGSDLLDFGRVRPTMSYTVGLGVVLLSHVLVEARFNGQFAAKKDVPLPDDAMLKRLRSNNLVLSVGYLF